MLIVYFFCLPKKLFNVSTATLIESRQGTLLRAVIADDGQWRFPEIDSVPEKFKFCLLQFEDAYFYQHPGFNPISIVNSCGANLSSTVAQPWFALPPLMEFYYKRTHPTYKILPTFRQDCQSTNRAQMEFIYPKNGSRITLTKNFDGEQNELVLKLARSDPETEVYWYLNETFLQQTQNFHELGLIPSEGKHKITAIDALGNQVDVTITIE